MCRDWSRRAFAALLLLCLTGLTFTGAEQSSDSKSDSGQLNQRVNQTVTMTVSSDGIVRFRGEGKLYREDVLALLRESGITKNAVTDIILEEGITEIGYRCLWNMNKLRTLKLGPDTARVAVRGVAECPALLYLWMPSGLKSIARDFLYGCDCCRVITAAETLPEMGNVSKERMLTGVDSHKALAELVGDEVFPEAMKVWWDEEAQ